MKFIIGKSFDDTDKKVFYLPDEYSIDCNSSKAESVGGVLFNDLSIDVDISGKAISISGLCPNKYWIEKKMTLPDFVFKDIQIDFGVPLQQGVYHRFNANNNWSTFVDFENKLLCIGNPDINGDAICFYPGAILVFVKTIPESIWLYDVENLNS